MSTVSVEKPLAGAVLCCTSVPPELRTQYADCAQLLGAEHKLDLTSDVTHLLVGDTDTLKYKYVARERNDVKVLRPEFVEAVRLKWMQAQAFDIETLENEYRLAPLHGLKICITGFDDITFRSQLQLNVLENGGQYSGDLTKEVTHLVAARPEGKKYEYATQWHKKVVSLKWYKDTLSRGMQLDESLYHPSKPVDEQGIGAWKHRFQLQPQPQPGKRQREERTAADPPRKLRRTASSRLSSQNDSMWTDIVTVGAVDADYKAKPPARPTISMPALASDVKSMWDEVQAPSPNRRRYFEGKYFAIEIFDSAKEGKLRDILISNGGVFVESAEALEHLDSQISQARHLLVPWQTPRERISTFTDVHVVSELWLEYCMESKSYVAPSQYAYGSLVSGEKPPGFSKLVIASNGFLGIQLLHTSKMVGALGAKYSELFNESTSVLVCKSGPDNQRKKTKMQRAQEWGIPVVSEKWLYSCIQNNRKQPFEAHLLQRQFAIRPASETSKLVAEKGVALLRPTKHAQEASPHIATRPYEQEEQPAADMQPHEIQRPDRQRPGSDFWLDTGQPTEQQVRPSHNILHKATKNNQDVALRDKSPNPPTKQPNSKGTTTPKRSLFGTLDGSTSFTDENQAVPIESLSKQDLGQPPPTVSNAHTLNSEIQDLLNIKAKAKAQTDATLNEQRKLSGRALSNLSNTSANSQCKVSRASSIESMNTDGVGREIGPVSASGRSGDANGPRSFTGRAKSRLLDGASNSIEVGNPEVSIEDLPQHEDTTPVMTQVVYDDPEETIMLREKLAAKRRARSKLGQKEDDPKPEKLREQQRRIKDDDVLTNVGWAGAGRTRRGGKLPTPEGLRDF